MTTSHGDIHPGMDVIGPRGSYIGNVEEVRDRDLLLNRPEQAGIYVPFDAVQRIDNGRVVLDVAKDDIDLKNWPREATLSGLAGGLPARPGPAGSGMPTGEPGYPTFAPTSPQYAPQRGVGNMTDDTNAREEEIVDAPSPGVLGANPTTPTGEPIKPGTTDRGRPTRPDSDKPTDDRPRERRRGS